MAEDVYYISHIQGVVKKKGQKKALQVGEEVYLNDSLSYDKPDSYLSVCSPEKGNFILKRDKTAPASKKNEFLVAVKDILVPATKTGTLGVRGGLLNNLFDLENYLRTFSPQAPMLVCDVRRIALNNTSFVNPADRFFYITYRYKQQDIDKKLSFSKPVSSKDTLFLLLDNTLYQVDGKPIDPAEPDSLNLYYRIHTENKNSLVSQVYIRYCTSVELLPELKVLYNVWEKAFTGKPDKEQLITRELRDHLVAHWGRLDEDTFRKLYGQVLRK
jgi:hypothetical protein